jgi:hypothetical protein
VSQALFFTGHFVLEQHLHGLSDRVLNRFSGKFGTQVAYIQPLAKSAALQRGKSLEPKGKIG